ncbi:Unknown protein, partial [Striga hermonthica]
NLSTAVSPPSPPPGRRWSEKIIIFLFSRVSVCASGLRPNPEHQERFQATVVAQFRDYQPEKFSGQGDPRIVDEWVQGLEIIFE